MVDLVEHFWKQRFGVDRSKNSIAMQIAAKHTASGGTEIAYYVPTRQAAGRFLTFQLNVRYLQSAEWKSFGTLLKRCTSCLGIKTISASVPVQWAKFDTQR